MEPLDRSTIWPYDEHGELPEFHYQRFGSPTVAAAEAALGELDGGAGGRRAAATTTATIQHHGELPFPPRRVKRWRKSVPAHAARGSETSASLQR